MTGRSSVQWLAACAVMLGLGCGDGGPQGGELTVELVGGSANLAALSFTLRAVPPNTIDTATVACGGCKLFLARVTEGELRGVITGVLASGPLLRVTVSDRRSPEAYVTQVLEAATQNYTLASTSGIRIEIPSTRQ